MNARQFAVVGMLCLLVAGCKQDAKLDTWIHSYQAEFLALEDDYELLKNEYFDTAAELEKTRQQNESLRKELGREGGGGPSGPRGNSGDNGLDLGPPKIDLGTPAPPKIDLGTPVDPDDLNPPKQPDGAQFDLPLPDLESLITPTGGTQRIEEAEAAPPADMHVTHIVIDPYLTAGRDFDRKPGDDGISVVFEPRNADDQFVPLSGAVWIAVLDPLLDGQDARVANWEFPADATHHRLKTGSSDERGMVFKLPWPNKPPRHSQLRVFVRYETADGRRLQDDAEIYFALPGEFSHRWTPKSVSSPPPRPDPVVGASFSASSAARDSDSPRPAVNSANHEIPSATARRDANPKTARRPTWQPFR